MKSSYNFFFILITVCLKPVPVDDPGGNAPLPGGGVQRPQVCGDVQGDPGSSPGVAVGRDTSERPAQSGHGGDGCPATGLLLRR